MNVTVTHIDGLRALVVLHDIDETMPPDLREGLVRRNIVMTTGRCPCGATRTGPNRAQRRAIHCNRAAGRPGLVMHAAVEHENGCPAIDEVLHAAITEWRGGAS